MLLNEWYNDVDYDAIETISWQRHLEEDYDEDDEGNPISMMLYNIEMTDSDGNTSYFDNLTEEELADELDNFESGEDIYKSIVNDTKNKGYENPKEFINTTPDNINDINSVIKIASKIWQIVEYVPNSRGYILPNGMLLYFGPNIDHMSISYITGMTIGRFVQLGAIRCGDNSFELACPPTYEQKRSLYKLIGGSKNNDIYVDIVKYDLSQPISNNSRQMKMYPDTICSAIYNNNNPKLILNQIDNYFQNGIKLGLSSGMSLRGENKKYNKIYRIVENIVKKQLNESYLRLTEDEEHSTEKIKPTTEWMTKWYDIMNKRLFNGELGACILRPFTTGKGSNGRTLGWFKITASNIKVDRSTRRIFKSDYYSRQYVDRSSFPSICKPCIELNANYSAPEDSWLNTLVHEMCHYYTYMYGYAPKQGHGPEFREIGAIVSSKSNGLITIQRLASAEEMTHFDLDADIKQKNQERLDRKKSNLNVCVIILDNKQVRLVTTTSMKLVDEIANLHNTKNNTLYFGCSHETGLVDLLYSKGYRSSMRTYRYWDISNASWLNILPEYQWNKVIGKCATIEEALGLENKDENHPSLAVANNNKQEETHLGYHIIKDGTGYNLYNTETKRKTFGNPVEKIWFDNEQNLFCFKNGKFTFIGTPGHWQKYNVQENINHKNMDKNTDKIKEAIRKKLREIIDEKINGNGEADSISISPDMNLGLESPFEIM